MPLPTAATSGGTWVTEHLGLSLDDLDSPFGLSVRELAGVAVRRGSRRSHLLVSTVLGKHVPTDPRIVCAAGLLLGRQVARVLAGEASVDLDAGKLLRDALAGRAGAASAVLRYATAARLASTLGLPPGSTPAGRVSVVGYAETATALGHLVADALPGAVYLHSTRRAVDGVAALGGFEEEHSHATSHLLLPEEPALLGGGAALILVDDELSTGQTALNTIALLQRIAPRTRYVVAALLDVRSPDDRVRMTQTATDLGVRLDVVALATGAMRTVGGDRARGAAADTTAAYQSGSAPGPQQVPLAPLQRLAMDWPRRVREGGRHGFGARDRPALDAALRQTLVRVAGALAGQRVLVLGCEELMYAPLRLAAMLLELPDASVPASVRFSTTTRSPVLAVDEPGYPIRTRLVFPAHDGAAGGQGASAGERYAYNISGNVAGGDGVEHIVLIVDTPADTPALHAPTGLLSQLRSLGPPVTLLVLPAYLPTSSGAR